MPLHQIGGHVLMNNIHVEITSDLTSPKLKHDKIKY